MHMEPMYFEWDKFIPTLEKHFPDIIEILNCDHQRHDSGQDEGQLIPAGSIELIANLRHGQVDREQLQRQSNPRFSQPKTKVLSQQCGSFCLSTPEISYNHNHNSQITSLC